MWIACEFICAYNIMIMLLRAKEITRQLIMGHNARRTRGRFEEDAAKWLYANGYKVHGGAVFYVNFCNY